VTALFAPAVKERLHARVAIDGPTGAGKTFTALQWARILAGPEGRIGVVDTENRSAAYYAPTPGVEVDRVRWFDPPYEFGHLPFAPPYDPRELVKIIAAAEPELSRDGVLVIDSLTHFWSGEGGTLDIVDAATERSRSSNKFTSGWKEGTPAQRHLLDTIIHAPFHVVVTMRSKMEYVLEEVVKDGKTISQPRKLGMAPEQRAGVEYEFTVVADMDLEHRLVVSKSRCDVIADVVAPAGRSHEPAQRFAAWLGTGIQRVTAAEAQALTARFDTVTDELARKELKQRFVAEFGRPAELEAGRLATVNAWLDQQFSAATRAGSSAAPSAAEPSDGGDDTHHSAPDQPLEPAAPEISGSTADPPSNRRRRSSTSPAMAVPLGEAGDTT
jgi:AAA domain-containing protein